MHRLAELGVAAERRWLQASGSRVRPMSDLGVIGAGLVASRVRARARERKRWAFGTGGRPLHVADVTS